MNIKLLLFIIFELIYFKSCNLNAQQLDNKVLYSGPGECCPFLVSIDLLIPETESANYKLALFAFTPNSGGLLSKQILINENKFDIELCYWESTLPISSAYHDTFLIDNLHYPEYFLNTKLYTSYSLDLCTKSDSTIISLKFNKEGIVTKAENIKSISKINIFPNPCSDYLLIQNNKLPSRYKIYDIMGKILIDNSLNIDQIDLRFLANGIYLLEIDKSFYKILKK